MKKLPTIVHPKNQIVHTNKIFCLMLCISNAVLFISSAPLILSLNEFTYKKISFVWPSFAQLMNAIPEIIPHKKYDY